MSIIKEGFLLKQGSMYESSWNKRYFILQSNLLLRFDKKPVSSSNPGQAKSATNLLGCTVYPSYKTNHQFCVDVIDSVGRKVCVLSCANPDEQREWIEALSAASKPVSSVSFPGLTVTPSVQKGPAVEVRQYSSSIPRPPAQVLYQGSPYYKPASSAYQQQPLTTQPYQQYQSPYPAQTYQASYPPPPTTVAATQDYPSNYPTGSQYGTQAYQPQYPTQPYQAPTKTPSSYSSAFPVFGGAYTNPPATTSTASISGPTPAFQPTQPYNPPIINNNNNSNSNNNISNNNNTTTNTNPPVNPFTDATMQSNHNAQAPPPSTQQRPPSQNPFIDGTSTNPFDQATPNSQYPYLYST